MIVLIQLNTPTINAIYIIIYPINNGINPKINDIYIIV